MDVASQASIEQFAHAAHLRGDVDGLRPERLPAGEREKLPGQAGPALGGLDHPVHEPAATIRIGLAVEYVEATGDHHQQIVEVVRHPAGQLSDGFDLLGLPKRLLDPGTLVHLDAQLLDGFCKGPRALDHQRLELLSRLFARREQGPDFILAPPRAQCRLNGAGQRHWLNRPFEQRDVTEKRDNAAAPGEDGRLLAMAGQDDEGQVGPGRLALDPLCQRQGVFPEQRFLGNENGADAGCHLADEFGQTAAADRFQVRTPKQQVRRARSEQRREHGDLARRSFIRPFGRRCPGITRIAGKDAAELP
ncbi:hypothetical protein AB7M73_007022 [Bradyrhizobium japonicum]